MSRNISENSKSENSMGIKMVGFFVVIKRALVLGYSHNFYRI